MAESAPDTIRIGTKRARYNGLSNQEVARGLPSGIGPLRVRVTMRFFTFPARFGLALLGLLSSTSAQAANWSDTEIHLQLGNLDVPSFAGGGNAEHVIFTLQHASEWTYGDNFFFIDVVDSRRPNAQDFDLYSEAYANFSLGKILDNLAVAKSKPVRQAVRNAGYGSM